MATTASPSATPVATVPPAVVTHAWPPGVILRDITRGGLAGLVAGLLVGGIGGRLVMRLATMAVPEATGQFTENGFRVGDITAAGTAALVVFVGLLAGVGIAAVWVTVGPWIPGTGLKRAAAAMAVAVALGSFALIDGRNRDFFVLDHDPFVVALLVGLVGLAGLAVALLDGWLDGRLPYPASRSSPVAVIYAMVTVVGLIIGLPLLLSAYLAPEAGGMGIPLVAVGAATAVWWGQRAQGADRPERWVARLGRGALAVAVLLGLVQLWGDLRLALLL